MFNSMLNHENIQIVTGKDYKDIRNSIQFDNLIYTGPIDEFFDYKYKRLPYRGINFSFKTYDKEYCLPVSVINYPNDHTYTRTTEFKHMTFQDHPKTTLCYENPADVRAGQNSLSPSYPVLNSDSEYQYRKYFDLASRYKNIQFMGRLGKFQYLNMDICIKQVLDL